MKNTGHSTKTAFALQLADGSYYAGFDSLRWNHDWKPDGINRVESVEDAVWFMAEEYARCVRDNFATQPVVEFDVDVTKTFAAMAIVKVLVATTVTVIGTEIIDQGAS